MSNYPDNFNSEAFNRTWGDDDPENKRNEDDIIESREEAKKFYSKTPMGKAIDSCFSPGATIHDQLRALNELTARSIIGETDICNQD